MCTSSLVPHREFTLSLSIEMPYEITSLRCDTHRIQTKVYAPTSSYAGNTVSHIFPTLSSTSLSLRSS